MERNSWYYDIKQFYQYQTYPLRASNINMKSLQRLVMDYNLNAEMLYKRLSNGTLLRCLAGTKAKKIALQKVHKGICETHTSGHMMTMQIQRLAYFWMTMEKDNIEYIIKCHKYHMYNDKINVSIFSIQFDIPWPFAMWGINLIRPFNQKTSNKHQFIVVAIDYFIK